ncbi:hypothetical protein FB565_006434 [Actinoplanes lutulentus]|uniref:Uncharacterized protein n=1 Tax=Actinoplanes lutulentus TaxID=1287878 RepID=A0A327ZBW9_9ACTN|nr:hypothetical protein [Actinoplanes lutulentus]MBB2946666.1 hypothetical protein [Actinoplanes lutulentus]RAK35559.1 hypothetical protein B0I29_10932 [Actinoplanes lutulentus]
MDVLLDAVDRVLESLRHRWPRALFIIGVTLWLLSTAAAVAVTTLSGSLATGVVIAALPSALLIIVTVRGLDRLPWPTWPLGVALPVFLAGLVAPVAQRFEDPFDWLVPILVFLYAQIFLGTLAAADELKRRRSTQDSTMSPIGSPAAPAAAAPAALTRSPSAVAVPALAAARPVAAPPTRPKQPLTTHYRNSPTRPALTVVSPALARP